MLIGSHLHGAPDDQGVPDRHNHRIQKFDSVGTLLAKWGTKGQGLNQFNYPQAIAFDASGDIFIADTHNDRMKMYGYRWLEYFIGEVPADTSVAQAR